MCVSSIAPEIPQEISNSQNYPKTQKELIYIVIVP